jgi:dGTPase
VRPERAPSLETQVVRLADRIGSILHDLDDALQAAALDLAQVERLKIVVELRKKLGRRYPQKGSRFMRTNTIHRGLTHLLVTGAIQGADAVLTRWAAQHRVRDEERFLAVRDEALSGAEVAFAGRLDALVDDLDGFLETKVRRTREADQVEARGRRVVLGLFAAYLADPSLLEDHALLRYKEAAGVRYLRDLPRGAASQAAIEYRRDPRYARLLADHIAGMTDAYAIAEHRRLQEMGAVPIPSAEQLRREEAE